ncbi:hypothetical protein [Sphingomonas sp. ACRSK]|uniref:hypothetical protein n=1 Tax=Sphingomonas sp. ACRSK TaxID=2918213 RepID=UPI001EF56985|nr:hypothetical protein [Sphingomonas sp. ACRSK]MCG7348902.1 hypothetical protein [Sphingomonas sp. ACRSK]
MTFALRTDDGDIWPGDTILVNGYAFGDRLLEDTLWELKVIDGSLTFAGLHEESRSYVENMASRAKIDAWGARALAEIVENDGDGLADDHETTLHWGES